MGSERNGDREDLLEYVRERADGGDDDFLAELKRAAHAAGIPSIWVAREQASLIDVLLRAVGARRVCEVGTLAGTTAIAMARALGPGGRVDTIECSPLHAAFAREWAGRSDVGERVVVHEGTGADVLPRLEAGAFDAVLVDADKTNYSTYVEHARRLLRPRGLLLVDNAFAFGRLLEPGCDDEDVVALREVNDLIAAASWLRAVICPVGDGMWVGVKEEPA